MSAVEFRDVDIVFGPQPRKALDLLDAGRTREEILAETGHVLGVAGASLSVARGEICVLMGLSGSGKSTLLRAVNRLNAPARGDVIVSVGDKAVNVSTCDAKTLRDLRSTGVSMVFQQFGLLPWRTVRDNVGLALELRGVKRAAREAVVAEKLAMVGLTPWAGKYAHQLSGGMQQRVGLARAFSTDADILLMDEPFSALDPLIRTKLQDELLALQAKLKKTILFVSHDLDEAIKLGNQIVIMEGGRIIQAGGVQDIILRPATPYVTDFVRHMNPLQALRASTYMRALVGLPRAGDRIALGGARGLTAALDTAGRPTGVETAAGTGAMLASADCAGQPEARPDLILAGAAMPLEQAIRLRHVHQCPLLVVDDGGAAIGLIGDDEIFRALAGSA